MQIIVWVTYGQIPSAMSQTDVMLSANGGHMGPKRDSQVDVFGIRFFQVLDMFRIQFSEIIYNSFSWMVMIFRDAFCDHFAHICLTFLKPLEP